MRLPARLEYPPSRRDDAADTIHGVRVPDPYRWLEDADSPETRAWVDAQNALTRSQLDGSARDALITRLTALYDHPRAAAPLRRGACYFFSHNTGLQDQAVYYVQDRRGAEPRVLIDPNAFSPDGIVALTAVFPSEDAAHLAYGLSQGGSDRQDIRIRDAATGRDLPDTLQWVKFASVAWLPDGTGFYYLRFPAPGTVPPEDEQYYGRIYFHRLGDAQDRDALVFERPEEKEAVPLVDVTPDGRFLVITCQRGASDDAEIYLVDRARAGAVAPRALFTGYDAAYAYVSAAGDRLVFRTTRDAERGKIIAVSAATGAVTEVVPESQDRLSSAVTTRDAIVAVYLHDACDEIRLFSMDGAARGSVPLPGPGTVTSIDAHTDADEVLFAFTSFTQPSTAYRCSLTTMSLDVLTTGTGSTSTPGTVSTPSTFSTSQVWYPSKDGTRISMFLVHKRGLPRDGARPVLLSGYGGFNISRTPQFDPGVLPLLEDGGVFALANLRGGGEYGEAWHRAGMLERKQTVFDDFIAAAEFMVREGYTTPAHLAIEGGSNGGLLVGAVMIQRPDLFGAVVCRVPVADMLRYHLFTVGRFWIPEYGSADDPAQFPYLLRYSPYHNVRDGVPYPPALVMTADTDDRVSPGMAKKLAARLQAGGAGGPFLIRIETKAGHGAGKPVSKLIEEDADILAFLAQTIANSQPPIPNSQVL